MLDILQGVRVLDLSHVVAGPLASFYLAQLGAEVIKVEPPGGEVMRAGRGADPEVPDGFVALNAGKRSLAVDIRQPEGARLVREFARGCDVFLENFRPGVMARHGLDEAAIRAVNPDIVYCSISGFGQSGEWADRPAYDHIVQAITGMMMMNGEEGDAPLKVGFPVIDVAVGLLAALSVVGALYARKTQGQGSTIDASMVQASAMLMYTFSSACLSGGSRPIRRGNRGYSGSPAADTYRCADGWLSVAANTPAQFRKLAALLGLEDLCEDPRALDLSAFNAPNGGFVVARDADYVHERIAAALLGRSAGEMESLLASYGVAAARVRTLDEFLQEAQDGKVNLAPAVFAQDERHVRTPGLGFAISGAARGPRVGAERLGASTGPLLQEMGIAADQIDVLAASGVLRVATSADPAASATVIATNSAH